MSEVKGPISQSDLMQRLVSAKKIMNMVDSGSYQKGNINEDLLVGDDTDNYDKVPRSIPPSNPTRSMGPVTEDKINRSKLPDNIKKIMIENPIQQITINDTMNMDMFQGAKKLMEREGMISKPAAKKTPAHFPQKMSVAESNVNSTDMITQLTPIIENIIRKVMDEKLNQILTAQSTASINENLVLRVGDSIFKGKITGVNKAK